MEYPDIEGVLTAMQNTADTRKRLEDRKGPLPTEEEGAALLAWSGLAYKYELIWYTYLTLSEKGLLDAAVFVQYFACVILSDKEFRSFAKCVYSEKDIDDIIKLAVERKLVWEVSGDPVRDAETYRKTVLPRKCMTMLEFYAKRGVHFVGTEKPFPLGTDGRYILPSNDD